MGPNARISKILSMYSDATREQLRVLLSAVERSEKEISEEEKIEYVLAIHYKSTITGNFFGFPAFNERNELLGFYQESRTSVGVARFVPVHTFPNKDLSPIEVNQATTLLVDAMKNNREAVYSVKDWGDISTLLDRVMVYDWQNKTEWWRNNE